MKTKNYFKLFLLAPLALILINCSGDDGTDGIDGIDGTTGIDGADGADGEGFDELTQYGSIVVSLDGTRPDGVAFTDTEEFRYTPVGVNDVDDFNLATVNGTEGTFSVGRFFSAPDDVFQENYVLFELDVEDLDLATPTVTDFQLDLSDGSGYLVLLENNDFFIATITDLSEISNDEITDFSYDDESNSLTFSYSFDVSAAGNDTGFDLSVSGTVDVILFEEIVND